MYSSTSIPPNPNAFISSSEGTTSSLTQSKPTIGQTWPPLGSSPSIKAPTTILAKSASPASGPGTSLPPHSQSQPQPPHSQAQQPSTSHPPASSSTTSTLSFSAESLFSSSTKSSSSSTTTTTTKGKFYLSS